MVSATGYTQGTAFLDPAVHDRLTDNQGNYLLYRRVLPLDVPHLSFAGYNSLTPTTVTYVTMQNT